MPNINHYTHQAQNTAQKIQKGVPAEPYFPQGMSVPKAPCVPKAPEFPQVYNTPQELCPPKKQSHCHSEQLPVVVPTYCEPAPVVVSTYCEPPPVVVPVCEVDLVVERHKEIEVECKSKIDTDRVKHRASSEASHVLHDVSDAVHATGHLLKSAVTAPINVLREARHARKVECHYTERDVDRVVGEHHRHGAVVMRPTQRC